MPPESVPRYARSPVSSRAPVNFHLGLQTFTRSGPDDVFDAMGSAAHSQQMRSVGVKPSWFASRPGGR